MSTADALERGREAFSRRDWGDAYAQLSAADRERSLEMDDLEQLGMAAYLLGLDEETLALLARAHREALRLGQVNKAVRHAFWLSLGLLQRGDTAQGSGWLGRAGRLLEGRPDSVERGYLLIPVALQSAAEDDFANAGAVYEEVARIADRFHDPDLATLAQLGRGEALIGLAEIRRGVALLDEAMVAVTAGELSPIVVGIAYCSVIETCQRIFDLRRAQEWTTALSRWVESQPDLVQYRGECLLYRAELMTLSGSWPEAIDEARRARDRLSRPPVEAAAGAAVNRQAELHRLRGDFAKAEEAYREASRLGRRPEPGLALLRLAQGQVGAASAAIRRSLDEPHDRATRPGLLDASVEIALAAGDLDAAHAASQELTAIASLSEAPILRAMADRADGAVRLARGDARAALGSLRRSWAAWRGLDAPYEAARTRVLIGRACRNVGDEDAATMELEAARQAFLALGASPDVRRLDAAAATDSAAPGGLTRREVEVLRLVAAGKTNRAVAADLVISEKTVARHVSNIFNKLGLSSRSAATAYAYEHDLVSST